MNGELTLDNIIPLKVKEMCSKNSTNEMLLRGLIKVDRAFAGDEFGWQCKDVPGLSGGAINSLMQSGIIKNSYKSNNYSHYRLNIPGEELTAILDEIELARLEQDKKIIEVTRPAAQVCLDPGITKEFEDLVKTEPDMLSYWCKAINPKIEGQEDVKKALLLCVASDNDKFGDRGRIHVLMHGDPGSSKSQLMGWIVNQLGAYFCSQRTSKVGLTGSCSGDELTPGALPRAHKGILCVDELDKYKNEDRQGMLEAMEEGKVHLEVGKISATLDAEARIIAAANRIGDFSPELKDRFDFVFEMHVPTGDTRRKVTHSIVQNFRKEKAGYYGIELKHFLSWIKNYEPDISSEVRDRTEQLLCMYQDLEEMKGSPRQVEERILRVSYTIAKINKRNMEVRDVITAIKLLNPLLNGGKMKALEALADSAPSKVL